MLLTGTGITVYTLHPGWIYGGMPLNRSITQNKEGQGLRRTFIMYLIWMMKL